MAGRITMFLLGVLLGYLTGFGDAQNHNKMVFVRAVERVQAFGQSTFGRHEREVEERLDEIDR